MSKKKSPAKTPKCKRRANPKHHHIEEATENGQEVYTEERGEAVCLMQESHSRNTALQGISERDSEGSPGRKLGSQRVVSGRRGDSVRAERSGQTRGGNASEKQNALKPSTTAEQAEVTVYHGSKSTFDMFDFDKINI